MRRLTFEELINGEINTTCILNEPLDHFVDFEVKAETALFRARRRWRMEPEHERE